MKLTFKPTEKYKGERTGLVVMGLDYAGLILKIRTKAWYCLKCLAPKQTKVLPKP